MSFDGSDSQLPFHSSFQESGQVLYTNSSSTGGVDFGMTIVNPSLGNGTYNNGYYYSEERNWIVVGVLIALIIMLWLILGGMLCYPIMRFIQRRIPVSKRRINRRYETIEGWLITKVRH